jgi:hypothetical protein
MAKMPPPGSDGPGLAIMIGVPKGDKGSPGGKMAAPGSDAPQMGGKASLEEAHVIPADKHCIDCENYDPSTGDCSKVVGTHDPDDACYDFFEPVADNEGNEQPDADDAAQPPMASGGDGEQ